MSFLLDMLGAFVTSDLGALLIAVFMAFCIVAALRAPEGDDFFDEDAEWEATQW